jgi:hypothetical protein
VDLKVWSAFEGDDNYMFARARRGSRPYSGMPKEVVRVTLADGSDHVVVTRDGVTARVTLAVGAS